MNKKGFTLVELLAVVAIMAVLIIIAVPSVLEALNKTKNKVFADEVVSIKDTAKTQYNLDKVAGKVSRGATYCNIASCTGTLTLDVSNGTGGYYIAHVNKDGAVDEMYAYNAMYFFHCLEGDEDIGSCKDIDVSHVLTRENNTSVENIIKCLEENGTLDACSL